MSQANPAPDFDEWLAYVFQKKHDDESFYHLRLYPHADGPRIHPADLAALVVRLNTRPALLRQRFDLEQIAEGFKFIFGVESEYFPLIRQDPVPEEQQHDVLRSLLPLYTDLFDPFSTAFEQQPESAAAGSDDLALAIFMLWDMSGFHPPGAGLEGLFPNGNLYQVGIVFEVFRAILTRCRSENCRASALHALGHIHAYHPDRVASLINEFLPPDKIRKRTRRSRHELPESLHGYARCAREGKIL